LVAWLATKVDRSAICRLVRVDRQTVGRIIERVGDEQLDERRLEDLIDIGIDEIAWAGQQFLTLVTDHRAVPNARLLLYPDAGHASDNRTIPIVQLTERAAA
jgi:hypothetical protein